MYRCMAMAAASFRFSGSRWNRECGQSQYVLQSSEVNGGNDEVMVLSVVCELERNGRS